MFELLRDMGYAILPVAIWLPICVLLEVLNPKTRHPLRDRFPGAIYVVLMPAAVVLVSRPLRLMWDALGVEPLVNIGALPAIAQFIVMLLVFDCLRYWEHRFEHRFCWPVHAVHHAPTNLHAANSYGHPLMAVPEFFLVSVPLSFIAGVGLGVIVAVAVVSAFQNLVIHSPLRLHAGSLRAYYVDSRFHRIHHSLEPAHWDKNFGLVFSFWDRLFGTAYLPSDEEWPATGVPGITPTLKPVDYLMQPLKLVRRTRG